METTQDGSWRLSHTREFRFPPDPSLVVSIIEYGSGKSHDLPAARPIPVRPVIVSNLSLENLTDVQRFSL